MKIKLPKYLYAPWLLTLALLLAVSVPLSAQSERKTDVQKEAERMAQQSLGPVGMIAGQNSNRPMAFPDPYCEIADASEVLVEEITVVEFAGTQITNDDEDTVLIDKTDVVVNITAGDTYTISVEGNTDGDFEDKIVAFIDWNQNGILDDAGEIYEVGILENSTGYDGVSVSMDITVPADAVAGQTRVRITKTYFDEDSDPIINPCGIEFDPWGMGIYPGYGQALDFTVDVSGGGGGTAGETCDDPLVVSSLPFDDAGNTGDYGNFYSNGDVPDLAPDAVTTGTGSPYYLSGDEVVYAYTPAENEVLNISTTNDDDWIGLWAFTGCPFTSTVGYHTSTSGSTRLIEELPVTAGETYYFVISTWAAPDSTDYTIHIEKVGGTGGGFVCDDQFNVSNGIENGLFFIGATNQQLAIDVVVGDDGFTAYGSNLNIFLDANQSPGDLTFDFTFYDDQAGLPGGQVHSSAGTVKGSEFVGSNFGYDVYTFEIAFDDPADFDANQTYWMEVESNGVAWESTSSGIFGAGMAFFNDNTGGDWVVDPAEDLVYSLICEEFEDTVYCIPEGTNPDRYIDNFATTGGTQDISNMGSGFSPDGYGDFYDTHTVAQEQGESVEFTVDIVGGISGFRVWVDWNQDGVFDTTEEVAYASSGYANSHTGTITVPADALEGDTRMRIVSHWLSTTGEVDPCETGFTYGEFEDYKFTVGEGTGGGGTACEQVFFDEVQPTGIGFSSGNMVANDITVAADGSFTLQTMTFDVVNLDGEPSEFDLEIFEDNGSGGVGTSTGITHHFDSSNMTFVENGTFSIYTQYTVTLELPDIELTADASGDARYWLAIASELSTTGDFTYWVSYDYVTNPDSYPAWQYNSTDGWFEYVDSGNLTKEGIMTVSGLCTGDGGDPDPCDAADVPYVQDFETATPPDMPECTTVVNAGTGNNWKTSTDEYGGFTGTFLEYEYHPSNPADSWFFTQGINLEAGTQYEITYGYGSRAAAAFPENLKIAYGDDNDPNAMTEVLAEHVGILSGGDKLMNTVEFTVPDSGVYYFGFNAFSNANEWYLYVDDIEIKAATVGIEDNSSTAFTYYPNPTRGVVSISANKDISTIAVFNLLGQQVLTMDRPENGQVNLSDLTTGTYLFRVMFEDGGLETFKVLKQ